MITKKKKPLPKGFTCRCGVFNEYPVYLFAHWDEELVFTCDCKRAYVILQGEAQEV
jgi:hypothetical protein